MGSGKIAINYQGYVGLDDARGILRRLLESFEAGKVVVRRGDEHVTLTPASQVEIELTGKHRQDRESLEIYLSWRLDGTLDATNGVLISSEEPGLETGPELDATVEASEPGSSG